MEFKLDADITKYNWKEVKEYYYELCNRGSELYKNSKQKFLTDFLLINRLYNSYSLEMMKMHRPIKSIYLDTINIIWSYFRGLSYDIEVRNELSMCLHYVAMDYNCGEDIPNKAIDVCKKYFPQLLKEDDTIHISNFENHLLGSLDMLLDIISEEHSDYELQIADSCIFPIAEGIISEFENTDEAIYSHPWFVEELKAVQEDMLLVLNNDINNYLFIGEINEKYKEKLFLSFKMKEYIV